MAVTGGELAVTVGSPSENVGARRQPGVSGTSAAAGYPLGMPGVRAWEVFGESRIRPSPDSETDLQEQISV